MAVQYIKTMLRKALHEAQVETSFWPLAARYIKEVPHYCPGGDAVNFPGFMSRVLARKRDWKREELKSVSEELRNIASGWADHGHWIVKESGKIAITRYTMKPAPRREIDEMLTLWRPAAESEEREWD